MNNSNIIIYDIANIDSTLAAAWAFSTIKKYGQTVKAFPASNKVSIDSEVNYFWIGVEPSVLTLEYFLRKANYIPSILQKILPNKKKQFCKNIRHIGYFAENNLNGSTDYFSDIVVPFNHSDAYSDATVFNYGREVVIIDSHDEKDRRATNTLLADSVLTSIFSKFPADAGLAWDVTRNVIDFQYGNRHLSINEQAMVYKNYLAAVDTLSHGGDFNFLKAEQEDEVVYLDFMKTVKRQLSTVFETSMFTIDGQDINVPMINVNQTLSPWVLKLLRNHYEYAITYEQRKQMSIFSVSGKYAGFENIVLKDMKANKIPCRLSNQL